MAFPCPFQASIKRKTFFPFLFFVALLWLGFCPGCGREEENATSPIGRVELPPEPKAEGEAGEKAVSGKGSLPAAAPTAATQEVAPKEVASEEDQPSRTNGEALRAYVTATALNVRLGPGMQNPVVGILLKYDPVTVTDRTQVGKTTWYAIEAAGGYVDGWVSGAYLAFGPPPKALFPQALDYGPKETPTLVKGPFKYVGVQVCRGCHEKSTGRFPRGAYPVWRDHFHSDAFRSLSRRYTQVIAQRLRGIEDPAKDWRCLKCHVTAYGADPSQIAETYRHEDGVGCEVCHGPGSEYARVDHGPSNPERYKLGFYKLTNLKEREELCVRCHNPLSPTYKPFNVLAFSRAIQHWPDPDDQTYFEHAQEAAQEREKMVAEVQRKEQEEAKRKAEEERARAEEEARKAEEERRRAEEEKARLERERREAEERARTRQEALAAALKRQKEEAEREAQRQAQLAATARATAVQATGIERYLAELPDVLILNPNGEKYQTVRFTHAAHANKEYVVDIQCQTCHHTQEGDERPLKCQECHGPGGEAGEEGLRTRATHTKDKPFPKEPGQEEVSCIGCHRSQNILLEAGQRSGKEAPTKCTSCHKRKRT